MSWAGLLPIKRGVCESEMCEHSEARVGLNDLIMAINYKNKAIKNCEPNNLKLLLD